MNRSNSMWEIYVPVASNDGIEYSLQHHKQWDEKVRAISGGLTVLKSAKGKWTSPKGKLYAEKMIPVRINCGRKQIERIIDLTLEHYNQEAVLAYRISDEVVLRYRK